MNTAPATEPGSCDAIEAEFVCGPVRCLRVSTRKVEDDGEWFYVCDEHIAQAERAEAKR